MDTLMRMQNSYDIAQARRRARQIKVARFATLAIRARHLRKSLRKRRAHATTKKLEAYEAQWTVAEIDVRQRALAKLAVKTWPNKPRG